MGRNVLLSDDDDPVTVDADAVEAFPSDESAALATTAGRVETHRHARVAAAFEDDPPANDEVVCRFVDDQGAVEVALAEPEGRLSGPGGSNPVDAGIWRAEGPIHSGVFVRIINDGNESFTLTNVIVYWAE